MLDTILLDQKLRDVEKVGLKPESILKVMLNLKENPFTYDEKIYLMAGLVEIYNNKLNGVGLKAGNQEQENGGRNNDQMAQLHPTNTGKPTKTSPRKEVCFSQVETSRQ